MVTLGINTDELVLRLLMILVRLVVLSVCFPYISTLSFADSSIAGDYRRTHEVYHFSESGDKLYKPAIDHLRIENRGDGQFNLNLDTVTNNGHGCTVEGLAQRVGDHLEYSDSGGIVSKVLEISSTHCVLSIERIGSRLVLKDVDSLCQLSHCGKRGSLDGLEFSSADGSAQIEWELLDSGLDLGVYKLAQEKGTGSITVLRADPTKWELIARSIDTLNSAVAMNARDWAKANKLTAAFNAGMFAKDLRTHVGYFKHSGIVNNGHFNKYQSLSVYGSDDPNDPEFRIIDLDSDDGKLRDQWVKRYKVSSQNLRLIKRYGINRWGPQPKKWSELALAEDDVGRILVVFSRTPLSMKNFNDILLGMDIGIVAAQHLEGGPEAQLYVKTATREIDLNGSYETGFNENNFNRESWIIPFILGLRPK